MFIAVLRYDSTSKSVFTILLSDDLNQMQQNGILSLNDLGHYVISNNLTPFNFSLDRHGKVVQDIGSFERLMNVDRNRSTSSSDLTCSNVILNEIQDTKGKTLGYRVINSDTLFVSNLKTDDLVALERYYNRPILQNGIIRNNSIYCYPHHPFLVIVTNINNKPKKVNKNSKVTNNTVKQTKSVNKEGTKKITSYNNVQNKELEECKKAGIDPKLISNPDLSNKQMRVLWMSKKNGARSEAFNNPDIPTDSMKFYADTIYTEKDEKDRKYMLQHPELSVSELTELNDCITDGVEYKDLIGKTDSEIFIAREHKLNERKVDNRTEEQKDFETFDKAIMAAMILKGYR